MIRRLAAEEWPRARDLRVRALSTDPGAFGSTVAREQGLPPEEWHARLTDSAWLVAHHDAGLVVLGRDDDGVRTLLSMWVDPGSRGTGVADDLVRAALALAPGEPVRLWVVEGNRAAQRLYARHGFAPTGRRAPLPRAPDVVQVELARPPTGPDDRIGVGYASTRQADPRVAAQVAAALADARSVVDVGAGTGRTRPPPRSSPSS